MGVTGSEPLGCNSLQVQEADVPESQERGGFLLQLAFEHRRKEQRELWLGPARIQAEKHSDSAITVQFVPH